MKQKLTGEDIKNMIRNIKWVIQYPKESNRVITTGCWTILLLPFLLVTALPLMVFWYFNR